LTDSQNNNLEPLDVLAGYASGIFPMGDGQGIIKWYEANPRGIISIEKGIKGLHVPRSLKQVINKNIFKIKIDSAFENVIRNCADRESTWINDVIVSLYTELHKLGYAHSVEAWKSGKLVGGLYGVALKGAFFGESMFHNESGASKSAVVKLYEVLLKNDYKLFDIQMITPVFEILGAVQISKNEYLKRLETAMSVERNFIF